MRTGQFREFISIESLRIPLVECHRYFGKVPERPGGRGYRARAAAGYVPLARCIYAVMMSEP
jgi:hypothetical protein